MPARGCSSWAVRASACRRVPCLALGRGRRRDLRDSPPEWGGGRGRLSPGLSAPVRWLAPHRGWRLPALSAARCRRSGPRVAGSETTVAWFFSSAWWLPLRRPVPPPMRRPRPGLGRPVGARACSECAGVGPVPARGYPGPCGLAKGGRGGVWLLLRVQLSDPNGITTYCARQSNHMYCSGAHQPALSRDTRTPEAQCTDHSPTTQSTVRAPALSPKVLAIH